WPKSKPYRTICGICMAISGRNRHIVNAPSRGSVPSSIALARLRREVLLELVGHAGPVGSVRRRFFLDRDIGPDLRIFGIQLQPAFEARLGIGFDRINR